MRRSILLNWCVIFSVRGHNETQRYIDCRSNNLRAVYRCTGRSGLTNTTIVELARLLKLITLAKSPLSHVPDRKNKIDKWAAPKYWAEVEYRDITRDGLLRHVTFRGLYAHRTTEDAARDQVHISSWIARGVRAQPMRLKMLTV